jgi:hypothetical protein
VTTTTPGPAALVTCAACDAPYPVLVHFELHDPGDWYDPLNPTGCRGIWSRLTSWCPECDYLSELVIAWHKGDIRHEVFWVAVRAHEGPNDKEAP